jgi:hypothetical protein
VPPRLAQRGREILVKSGHSLGQEEAAEVGGPLEFGLDFEVIRRAAQGVEGCEQIPDGGELARRVALHQRRSLGPRERSGVEASAVPGSAGGIGEGEVADDDEGDHGGVPIDGGDPAAM